MSKFARVAIPAAVAVVAAVVFLAATGPAPAGTTYVVTVLTDNTTTGNCTLREAIKAANTNMAVDLCPAGSGADTITLGAGNYTLSIAGANEDGNATGDLDITDPLTIQGLGSGSTSVDAGFIDRAFDVIGTTATFSGLTIKDGLAVATPSTPSNGGGIRSTGTLTVNDSLLTNNGTSAYIATFSGDGGGIASSGSLTLLRSSLTMNATDGNYTGAGSGKGGGLATSGSATIADSVFDLNDSPTGGGGIQNSGALTATGLTLTNNTGGQGGGLRTVAPSGTVVSVARSLISGNFATSAGGGGVADSGPLSLIDSTVANNRSGDPSTMPSYWHQGGGIWVDDAGPTGGFLTLLRSTVTNNTGSNGDGIGVYGSASITDSTISGNGVLTSNGNGGGLQVGGTATVTLANSTFGDNIANAGGGGGNIYVDSGGAVTAKNTLALYSDANCVGTITSLGHNLDFTAGSGTCFTGPSDLHVDPLLGSLADNGGPTKTRALPAGSPAVDAGDTCSGVDQRGTIRPQGSGCDIGAYELLQPFALTVTVSGNGTVTSSPAGIACPPTCTATYAGETVALTPHPGSGRLFGGWTGACSGKAGCSVVMTAARSAGASFVAAPPPPPPPPVTKPKCVVPKVLGKTLTKAKAAIKKGRCRTGKVTRAYSKRMKKGRVLAQRPKAGKRLVNGAKVNLVLSRGKRR